MNAVAATGVVLQDMQGLAAHSFIFEGIMMNPCTASHLGATRLQAGHAIFQAVKEKEEN